MVQRIIPSIGHPRIRAFDWSQPQEYRITMTQRETVRLQKKNKKRGILPAENYYFFGLSASYSASMGAMVFVDIDRLTRVVSFRQ
jgi:hypothetical protein